MSILAPFKRIKFTVHLPPNEVESKIKSTTYDFMNYPETIDTIELEEQRKKAIFVGSTWMNNYLSLNLNSDGFLNRHLKISVKVNNQTNNRSSLDVTLRFDETALLSNYLLLLMVILIVSKSITNDFEGMMSFVAIFVPVGMLVSFLLQNLLLNIKASEVEAIFKNILKKSPIPKID